MKLHQRLALLLAILLLLACAGPAALAAGSFQAVVTAASMKVYAQKSPYGYLGALPKGTVVTVESYSGGVALISFGGRQGLARVSDMAKASGGSDQAAPADAVSRTMVTARDTRVYKQASTSSSYVAVKAGTTLNLLAVSGGCAKVERDGKVGYVAYSHLTESGAAAEAAAPQAEEEAVQTGRMAVVTRQSTRIYKQASTASAYVTVDKGTALTLLAVKGDCAMVERGDSVGYVVASHLTAETAAAPAAEAKTQPSIENRIAASLPAGSNEQTIFKFLVSEMGYNAAAACGVLANVKYESSYNPGTNGDRGTSYGICQWHAGRKSSLISWCESNGYDYTTLEGQLYFLKYELPALYPKVHSYLKNVENTADGAYDAGYYFCFNFEAPAARTSQSTKRAEYASNTLFVK